MAKRQSRLPRAPPPVGAKKGDTTSRPGDIRVMESLQVGISMTSSNAHDRSGADTLDLHGIHVLLVEDSWHLGVAMKKLLQLHGADVAGPAANTAAAERLSAERQPARAVLDCQ